MINCITLYYYSCLHIFYKMNIELITGRYHSVHRKSLAIAFEQLVAIKAVAFNFLTTDEGEGALVFCDLTGHQSR